PLVARRRTPRCFGGTRVAGRRDLRQGAGRAGAVRAHARRLPRLGARSPPAAAHRHPAWPRRPRRPRPRLVRGRARGLGSALRARAPDGALPSQPGRRAGRRRCLLAEVARLPPPLLREAPAGGRAPVDAVHGAGALAGVADGRLPRPAPALPPLLGGGSARRLHARGVEAPLLPPAQPARARAGEQPARLAEALCPRRRGTVPAARRARVLARPDPPRRGVRGAPAADLPPAGGASAGPRAGGERVGIAGSPPGRRRRLPDA